MSTEASTPYSLMMIEPFRPPLSRWLVTLAPAPSSRALRGRARENPHRHPRPRKRSSAPPVVHPDATKCATRTSQELGVLVELYDVSEDARSRGGTDHVKLKIVRATQNAALWRECTAMKAPRGGERVPTEHESCLDAQ